ncbi:MAG TPA: hypothetical protein VK543_14980 [Puia sp.]|nr:hypothetical protein [Puia sp.]
MLKKITSILDIEAIRKDDSIFFDHPDEAMAKIYQVARRLGDDLIVSHLNGSNETKLLTKNDLFSGNWWRIEKKGDFGG